MHFANTTVRTPSNFLRRDSSLIDAKKIVNVLNVAVFISVSSSCNPTWNRFYKIAECSAKSLSSKVFSQMISIRYISESLMFKTLEELKVLMMFNI
jgi:hypothetical protein